MGSNTIATPLSDREIGDEKGILPFLNKEARPLLREIRKVLNSMLEPVVETVTAAHTMTDEGVIEYTGAGGITITLPAADAVADRSRARYIINNGTGAITLAAASGDTVNGAASVAVEFGACAVLVCNGDTKWSAGIGIPSTSATAGATPVLKWGRSVVITAGLNVLAMGIRIAQSAGNGCVLLGTDITTGANGNTAVGTTINMGSATSATAVGKDLTFSGTAGQGVAVGNSITVANGAAASVGIGGSLTVSHANCVLQGNGGATDQAGQWKMALNGVHAVSVINNPASGTTGMSLVCDVGGGIVTLPVTLAASVGGQRALRVAG